MNPDRHEQVKAIFLEVVAAPAADRSSLISRACDGDETLLAEVKQLLAHHNDADRTMPSANRAVGASRDESDVLPNAQVDGPISEGQSSPDSFSAGTMIGDRYRIVTQLGRGGMGVVYHAEDMKLAQHVALKFLSAKLSRNPVWVARLREEVRIARAVTHPGVCRVYDIGEAGELHYLTMEYVEGEDLASLLQRAGPLTREKAFQLGRQICLGLHAAHRAGVVHRDLKPGNILIDGSGNARITDFGLAILPGQGLGGLPGGTPAYMAPEQLTGKGVTALADIYALGLVLYELLAGQSAIRAGSIAELLDPSRRPVPTPLGSLVKDLPPGLEGVIERCLSLNPAARPPSALQVAAELPGADVLAAALEAGETPTPDLIAAASFPFISGRWRALLGVTTFSLLGLLIFTKSTSKVPWDNVGSQPPAVLRDRGERLLNTLLRRDLPAHRAIGFCDADELEQLIGESSVQTAELRVNASRGPFFWLRAAPAALVPLTYENVLLRSARTTLNDPPVTIGSAVVSYDRDGRLMYYRDIPATNSELLTETRSVTPQELETLLVAAAVTSEVAIATPSDGSSHLSVPVALSNQQSATASFSFSQGRTSEFAVLDASSASPEVSDPQGHRNVAKIVTSVMFLGLMVFAIPWAWRSYRSGYADLRGAFRLGLAVFIVALLAKALRLPAGIGFMESLQWLVVSSIFAAGAGALLSAFYLALDRHSRRYWPDKLITWTRAVDLRWADAALREHVLAGIALGVFWGLLAAAERRLISSIGWPVRSHLAANRIAERLLGIRSLVAGLLDIVPSAILYGLLFMLVLVVAQRLTQNRTWAAALAWLVLVVALVPRGASPYTAWAFYGLGCGAVSLWAMMRFGLLTLVVGLFVVLVLNTTPMTLDLTSWYADMQLIVLGLIAIGVLYGVSARPHARLAT